MLSLSLLTPLPSHLVAEAAISQDSKNQLDNGEVNQGSGTTSSPTSGRRQQADIGGSFGIEGTGGTNIIKLSTSKFQLLPGFIAATVAATTPGSAPPPNDQLDMKVLYAKTDPMGMTITPKTWQRDADPIFIWESPSTGLDIKGYSYALDQQPDDTIDTTGTSWDVAHDPIQKLADGKHTFWVKAINTAGKSGKPASVEVWVDTTAPVINSYSPTPGVLLNTLSPLVSVRLSEPNSGIDPASGVSLSINGSPASVTYDEPTGTLSASSAGMVREGSNRIELRVSDRVGNAQTPLVWSFTADVRPPSGTILINAGASMTTSVYVTLNLSASDATSSVSRMLISNDPLVGYVEEPYVSVRELWRLNAVRGAQKVYVKFVDGAGNISEPVSAQIDLGLLAPETIILSGPAGLTPERTAKFTFSCPEGSCVFSYAFDNNAWSGWTTEASATVENLTFGNHYFKVKAAKEVNGIPGIQPDEEDPTPAERTWIVGVEAPELLIPRGAPIKLWRVE